MVTSPMLPSKMSVKPAEPDSLAQPFAPIWRYWPLPSRLAAFPLEATRSPFRNRMMPSGPKEVVTS